MKALIGGGGFSREVRAYMRDDGYHDDIHIFVDDAYAKKDLFPLSSFDPLNYEVLIAIGDSAQRASMAQRMPANTRYFSFIHSSAKLYGKNIKIGDGSIICPNCILTDNIQTGQHCIFNLSVTIGHDCVLGSFITASPQSAISGNCKIGDTVYLGTNAAIREKISISSDVVIGMNSCVVKNIDKPGIYVGCPAKMIVK